LRVRFAARIVHELLLVSVSVIEITTNRPDVLACVKPLPILLMILTRVTRYVVP
jgi:hypothetical protein